MYQTLDRGGMVECSYDRVVLGRRVQCHKFRGSVVVLSDYKDTFHATEILHLRLKVTYGSQQDILHFNKIEVYQCEKLNSRIP